MRWAVTMIIPGQCIYFAQTNYFIRLKGLLQSYILVNTSGTGTFKYTNKCSGEALLRAEKCLIARLALRQGATAGSREAGSRGLARADRTGVLHCTGPLGFTFVVTWARAHRG